MAIQKAKYEALSDFNFRNIETGLYVFVKAGDQYCLEELDRKYDAVRIVGVDGDNNAWLSLYEFVTKFGEVKHKL